MPTRAPIAAPSQRTAQLPRWAAAFVVTLALLGQASAQQAARPGERDWEEEYSWNLARRNGTPEAYQWFLDRYPSSRYSTLAWQEVVGAIVAGSSAARGVVPTPAAARSQPNQGQGISADGIESSGGNRRR